MTTLMCFHGLYRVPYFRKLLGNVPAHEHGLQVDPEVLDGHPVLDDVRGVGQVLDPLLDLHLERSVVSAAINKGLVDLNTRRCSNFTALCTMIMCDRSSLLCMYKHNAYISSLFDTEFTVCKIVACAIYYK